jgi:hypothetical protein
LEGTKNTVNTTESTSAPRATGGCLCGAVRYALRGELRGVYNCHCGQCRRSHGHLGVYTSVTHDQITFSETGGLKWYQSSAIARRGFCGECGSSLFWEPADKDHLAIAAGSIDQPSGLITLGHIFTADRGDYYTIDDGLECWPGTMSKDTLSKDTMPKDTLSENAKSDDN